MSGKHTAEETPEGVKKAKANEENNCMEEEKDLQEVEGFCHLQILARVLSILEIFFWMSFEHRRSK